MRNLFSMDSPIMIFLGKAADLIVLNIVFLICCIPIVTIGSSVTAMYYVLLKLHREESNYLVREFFRAFCKNFKKATILWILYLIVIGALIMDYWWIFQSGIELFTGFKVLFVILAVILLISMMWSFVLLSRYENTIRGTLINSYGVGLMNLYTTIMMALLAVLPWVIILWCPGLTSVVLLVGFSFAGYMQTILFNRVFEKLESKDQ